MSSYDSFQIPTPRNAWTDRRQTTTAIVADKESRSRSRRFQFMNKKLPCRDIKSAATWRKSLSLTFREIPPAQISFARYEKLCTPDSQRAGVTGPSFGALYLNQKDCATMFL
ncbi:hypothetical protein EVAR_44773_1 [Eumeta japonica]|uniref:Uncharacterized protein n=1 Tax=Eumeta variegata TaxID=151549 RepID=A0A4C1YA40_EUMVA|nr:hypothetical protein EVAR_44773_1 [Eumeta japonica]